MANTRETLGDQATVDALVANTLTSLEESGIVTLRSYALSTRSALTSVNFPNLKTINTYAFNECTGLKSIELPAATSIGTYAFTKCTALETVDLSGSAKPTISANAFNGCSALKALIIRSTTMAALSNTSAFTGTLIASGSGAIYVPADLVDTYKANSNWSNYFIASIDDYPLSDYSTISDSWAEIFAAEDDGTYKTKYSIGDTKALMVNNETVYMQIVAMDTDALADGSGNAKITWVAKNCLSTTHRMNASNVTTNGWLATEMRTWLRDTILATIDSAVTAKIKEVTKTYKDVTTGSTLSTTDTIWIPSYREIFGGTSYEDSGCVYTGFFSSAAKWIKYRSGSAYSWWLRSAYSSSYFRSVSYNGGEYNNNASGAIGVVLGFCT